MLADAVLGEKSPIDWKNYLTDYDLIRQDIETVLPEIFINYNEQVRKPGGFYLPNPNREQKFDTETGKAKFHVATVVKQELEADDLSMMTIRSHDQFNTTIYGLNDRYRGIHNERRIIFMNQQDMNDRGIGEKEVINIYNFHNGIERVAHKFIALAYPIPKGNCATYFPETNVLVPIDSVADYSGTPTSKLVVVKVKKQEALVTD
jgi:anaerobic selenocysteine-containing dehydrogenase